MDFVLGILFAVVAMIGFGISNAVSQYPVRKIGLQNTIFYRGIVTSSIAFLVLLVIPFEYSFNPVYVLIAAAIGLMGFIPLFTFFKALNVGKVGIVSPIANSSFLVAVLFSVLFYGEPFGQMKYVGLLILLLGIVTLSIDFEEIRKTGLKIIPGVSFALISFFLWGTFFFLEKIPVVVIGPYLLLFIVEFSVFLPALLSLKGKPKKPDKRTVKFLMATGISGALAGIGFNLGITFLDVSIVTPIAQSAPIISVITARILFGEKLKRYQYLSIVLAIVGVVMLSLF